MLAKKELENLVSALKSSPEYTEMMQLRKKIMSNPVLSRKMQDFEREHSKLLNLDIPEKEMSDWLDKLYNDNKDFLETEVIRLYTQKMQDYQNMIYENLDYLNILLDTLNT